MLTIITTFALMGFLATALWAPFLISLLYKLDIVIQDKLMANKMNAEFMRIHGHKVGTPTLGGLMISVTVTVLTFLIVPQSTVRNVFIFGWIVFTMFGLLEGSLVYGRKLSDKFRLLNESFGWRLGKLGVLYLITLGMLILTYTALGLTSISFFSLAIPFNMLTVPVGAFLMMMAIYGMEITDGADGLVTGQFLVALVSFLVISRLTNQVVLYPIIAMIVGSCLVYLYFNINPARVFMGGTGTFPIAFALLFFALVTNTVDIFVVLGLVFWIEVTTSTLQILSMKFLHRRIFRIAPIHHYFEAIGWPETKMVQRFWLATASLALLALWIFALTRGV